MDLLIFPIGKTYLLMMFLILLGTSASNLFDEFDIDLGSLLAQVWYKVQCSLVTDLLMVLEL